MTICRFLSYRKSQMNKNLKTDEPEILDYASFRRRMLDDDDIIAKMTMTLITEIFVITFAREVIKDIQERRAKIQGIITPTPLKVWSLILKR